jgi:predicted flap endonuclease-1-like 5' DNA nuclease
MRVVYAIIAFFLLLSVFFARWYVCNVRGLCEPAASFEILTMIIIALGIGFTGSWLLNERTFRFMKSEIGSIQNEKSEMQDQLHLLEKENRDARKHMAEWQQEVTLLAQVKKVTEPLLMEAKGQVTLLEQELEQYQRRYDRLKQETDEIRDTADKLKNELLAEKMREARLEEKGTIPEPSRPNQSRFTPSSWQTKNDLTQISGIGPAIQRKLNEIGIYSFQQIAELTPESVEQISKAIKFFPDRIGRDNWIGQAAALMKKKGK